MDDHMAYNVACAGAPHGEVEKIESTILLTDDFFDYDGKKVNVGDFLLFIVSGESMMLSGIHDKDIVFVPKNYSCGSESLPSVFVLKINHPIDGEAKYKIRRGWRIVKWQELENEYEKILKSIMSMDKFKSIKDHEFYLGDEKIIDDFKKTRLPNYKKEYALEEKGLILISTTLLTDEKEIHFSIHPVDLIVGRISFSYSPSK